MKMIVIRCKLVARLNGILVRMLASLPCFFLSRECTVSCFSIISRQNFIV